MGIQGFSSTVLGLWLTSLVFTAYSWDCNQRKDGFYSDPADCHKFYRCLWGKVHSYQCPMRTMFNLPSSVCDWSRNVQCVNGRRPASLDPATTTRPDTTTSEPSCVGRPTGAMFRDPNVCSSYYWCIHGNPLRLDCPPGLVFNNDATRCDWPSNVNCNDNSRPATARPTAKPTSGTTTRRVTVRPGTSATTTATYTTKRTAAGEVRPTGTKPTGVAPTPGSEPSCVGRPTGAMFRDPNVCSSYYRCIHGNPLRRDCPPGLVFNNDATRCDWPFNVNCNDNSRPATARPTAKPTSGTTTRRVTVRPGTSATTTATYTTKRTAAGEVRPTGVASTPGSGCARRVCYYTNWSQYRPQGAKYFPEDIDPSLCSHMIYSFAKLNGNNLTAFEWNDETTPWMKGMYERFNDMKSGTNVKTLLAVGGWNLGSAPFTKMVATAQSRQAFADQSLSFLKSRGFDGLDLDWEYPANRGSPAEDKGKFTLLVKQLRETFNRDAANNGGSPLLLSAAVAAGKSKIDTAYDVVEISKHLDFINLMSYDLHGSWESQTGHQSALYRDTGETAPESYLNVDWAARYWASKGCPKHKLVIGIPTYGRSFTLQSTASTGVGAPTRGAGTRGQFTREAGFLSYYEVCRMNATAQVRQIESQNVPYLVKGDQWVGYDDIDSVRGKARYAKDNGYGGVMTWALDLDDFSGTFCGQGKYPLWSAVNNECSK